MITDRSREEVKALAQRGEINIKALSHYDVCKAREAGKSASAVAKEFNITRRQVFWITGRKCPKCEE